MPEFEGDYREDRKEALERTPTGRFCVRGRLFSRQHCLCLTWGLAGFFVLCCTMLVPAWAARPPVSTATSVAVTGKAHATTFELLLSKGVPAEIFTLASPYRIIVDLPDVAFRLPRKAGQRKQGLVKAFRYGLFAEGKARIVIDTEGPVIIAKAGMTRAKGGVLLTLMIVPTDAKTFGGGTGATQPDVERREARAKEAPPAPKRKPPRAKPVIVIDAGHGGIDPGTMSSDGVLEKNVVLAVAKQLQAQLKKTGRYAVKMTRTKDVFVSLDQRLKFSEKEGGDIFISLHADSIESRNYAESVRGATIYTLSERASDEQARRMAEKENASDLIAGLETASIGDSNQVKTILIDLLKRETSNFSADFSNVLLGSLKKSVMLSKDPQRSAAFKVLKQPNVPSVLVELGYMSNSKDEAKMTTSAWQKQVAKAITKAVDRYFLKRGAQSR